MDRYHLVAICDRRISWIEPIEDNDVEGYAATEELKYHPYTVAFPDDDSDDVFVIVNPGLSPEQAAKEYLEGRYVPELLPWYVNGTLDDEEIEFVEKHLDSCEYCKNYQGKL
jgi:hypothetical protein